MLLSLIADVKCPTGVSEKNIASGSAPTGADLGEVKKCLLLCQFIFRLRCRASVTIISYVCVYTNGF